MNSDKLAEKWKQSGLLDNIDTLDRTNVAELFECEAKQLLNEKINIMEYYKPLGDRVLVKYTDVGEKKSKTGIILKDSSTRGETVWGEVLAVGNGLYTQSGNKIPMEVKVGDNVMYKKDMVGDPIIIEDEKYLLFRESELLMVNPK
jgi:chaperonin GroES